MHAFFKLCSLLHSYCCLSQVIVVTTLRIHHLLVKQDHTLSLDLDPIKFLIEYDGKYFIIYIYLLQSVIYEMYDEMCLYSELDIKMGH